jgi:hypothetical protein
MQTLNLYQPLKKQVKNFTLAILKEGLKGINN